MIRQYKQLSGFALVEVSIALLILGIVSSISMSQFATLKRLQAEQITQAHIDYIVKALGTYYNSKGGYLPYPSSLESNTIGKQVVKITDFGIIPFKTLGIMEKYAKDGYGHWLLYKLHPDFGKGVTRDRTLGISEFDSDLPRDKVAFIIKSDNGNITWYSEMNFIQIFSHGKVLSEPKIKPKLSIS